MDTHAHPTDKALEDAAKKTRSRTLARMYREMAASTLCSCDGHHNENSSACAKAAWQKAAMMATGIDEFTRD